MACRTCHQGIAARLEDDGAGIIAVCQTHQDVVAAPLDDLPVLQDRDQTCTADRTEAMRDGNRGPVFQKCIEAALYQHLRIGIERTGRFVEDDQLRLAQKCAGDRDALLLPPESLTPRSPTSVS